MIAGRPASMTHDQAARVDRCRQFEGQLDCPHRRAHQISRPMVCKRRPRDGERADDQRRVVPQRKTLDEQKDATKAEDENVSAAAPRYVWLLVRLSAKPMRSGQLMASKIGSEFS